MIHYGTFFPWITVLICVHFSNGASLNKRLIREIKNDTDCDELDKPGWTIGSLAYVTMDVWPWKCLQSRFTNDTLHQLVWQFSLNGVYEATSRGYIGFVQYYMDDKNLTLGKNHKAYLVDAAVKGGHLNVLKYFLEEKAFPIDSDDARLLLSAAFGGNVDLIKYLIEEKNVTKNGIASDGSTALHAAALGGKLEAVRFFVETLKYKVNIKSSNGETPAHIASIVSLPILEYLIEEKGADLNSTDDFRNTLLHSAAYYGQLDVVKYLVERKHFDIEIKDRDGVTALHKATRNGQFNVVKYLAEERRANLNGKDIFCMNLLHQAVIGNNLDVMKFLVDDMKISSFIEEMNFYNRTVPLEAAKYGTLSILRYLLDEKQANTSTVDEEGCTLLHIAARENQFPTVLYLVEEKGFNVMMLNTKGRTAYDLAVIHKADGLLVNYLEKKMYLLNTTT